MESSVYSPSSLYSDDDRLNMTWKESEKRERASPSLRDELRQTITRKRIKYIPTPISTTPKLEALQHQLTDDEIRRKERRREQNRRAAERCREKKKTTQSMKEKEKEKLLRNNKELIDKICEMKRQLVELKKDYNDHVRNGLCFQKHNNNGPNELVTQAPEHSVDFRIPTVVTEKLLSCDESGANLNACLNTHSPESLDRSPTTCTSTEYVTDGYNTNTDYAPATMHVQNDLSSDHGSSSFQNDCSLDINYIDNRVPDIEYSSNTLDSNNYNYRCTNIVNDTIYNTSEFSSSDQQPVENFNNGFPLSNSIQAPMISQQETFETPFASMYEVIPVTRHGDGMSSEYNTNIPDISNEDLEVFGIGVNDPQLFSLMRNFDM